MASMYTSAGGGGRTGPPGCSTQRSATPWRARRGRARSSTCGCSTRTPRAPGAVCSTAASRMPVPPAMSAMVPELGQSRTGHRPVTAPPLAAPSPGRTAPSGRDGWPGSPSTACPAPWGRPSGRSAASWSAHGRHRSSRRWRRRPIARMDGPGTAAGPGRSGRSGHPRRLRCGGRRPAATTPQSASWLAPTAAASCGIGSGPAASRSGTSSRVIAHRQCHSSPRLITSTRACRSAASVPSPARSLLAANGQPSRQPPRAP